MGGGKPREVRGLWSARRRGGSRAEPILRYWEGEKLQKHRRIKIAGRVAGLRNLWSYLEKV